MFQFYRSNHNHLFEFFRTLKQDIHPGAEKSEIFRSSSQAHLYQDCDLKQTILWSSPPTKLEVSSSSKKFKNYFM